MKQSLLVVLLMSVLVLTLDLTAHAQESAAPEANLIDACVTDFDPSVDYFPDKVEVADAENFSVEYFNNYKVVTVQDAFIDAPTFNYVLVQCGTPAPDADDFPEGTQFIEVPAGNIISLSTTQLPHLDALNLLDHLVGVDGFDYISNPAVREMIDNDELAAVGLGATINVEVVLDLEPGLVLTSGFDPNTDAHPVLIDAGIFTALNADWREGTPLGRAEWIKYVALFYNAEAEAQATYDTIVTAYNEARELAASVPEDQRPDVLWNSFSAFSEVWSIPGTETYAGRLIQDAGGLIAPADLVQAEQNDVAFEAVYEQALDTDIWVTNLFGVFTEEDLLAVDPRYADFMAFESGNVWNNNLDVNEFGGQNYFELGVTNPHLILRDLVAIFHPDLLPDHEFVFYRRLEPAQ